MMGGGNRGGVRPPEGASVSSIACGPMLLFLCYANVKHVVLCFYSSAMQT